MNPTFQRSKLTGSGSTHLWTLHLESWARRTVDSRWAWATQWLQGQPGLRKATMHQKKKNHQMPCMKQDLYKRHGEFWHKQMVSPTHRELSRSKSDRKLDNFIHNKTGILWGIRSQGRSSPGSQWTPNTQQEFACELVLELDFSAAADAVFAKLSAFPSIP